MCLLCFFFFKQKTAYEMRISDWSSDVCSSDLVLRGRAAAVDGIVFQNMRVPDANGAGIRLERGNLEVANSLFRNSEQGILTADDTASEIRIARSTFQHLGRCDRGLSCAHSIYVGAYGKDRKSTRLNSRH